MLRKSKQGRESKSLIARVDSPRFSEKNDKMREWGLISNLIDGGGGASMTEAATRLIHRAIDRSDDGDHEGAIKLLVRAIKAGPANAQAYHQRAMALANLERYSDAVADFERALALDSVFPGTREWLARTLARLGEHRRAAEEWLRYLRDNPDGSLGMGVCPQDWADCAQQFVLAGDPARAVALLEEYLARHAARVAVHACYETAPLRLLARLLLQAGQAGRAVELARAAYSNVKHRCPMDFVVYGLALEAAGHNEESLKVAEEALLRNDQMEEAIALKRRLLADRVV
jgi:tetratricopeptide (TPR) repeat protein